MKIEKFDLKAQSQDNTKYSPWIRVLEYQANGSLLCGLVFAQKPLLRINRTSADSLEIKELDLELGSASLGVWSGLRSTTTGATTMCALNTGMLPGFVASIFSKNIEGRTTDDLEKFLLTQDGGLGLWARHSVVMLSKDELTLRHEKNPGGLTDIALVGDYLFGLSGSEIWREHYLKADKRETLRSDLEGNFKLHRASDGNFWLLGQNQRLLRMAQTDIRAKPTPLKLPGGGAFVLSAASSLDGWLYGTCNESKTLFRVRLNKISAEEEIQKIYDFENPVSALLVQEFEDKGRLLLTTSTGSGAELFAFDLVKPEDAELLPEVPQSKSLGAIPDLSKVGLLCSEDSEKGIFWAAEGYNSASKTRLLRIEL
jgi:hypothetical protein